MDAKREPMFAQDANGDTLPDRDANGTVVLDPNGIPFQRRRDLQWLRPFGKSQTERQATMEMAASGDSIVREAIE